MRYAPDTQHFAASATDLANHARCEHLTQRSRALAVAIAEGRAEPQAKTGLQLAKGSAFEADYVAQRRAEVEAAGGRFVDVSADAGDARGRRELLERAMREGVELIAQAPMRAGALFGYADLLERVADGATPGGRLQTVHRYEPHEIKYGRSVKPEHLLQASAYADALERLQGELPARLHVVIQRDGRAETVAHVTSEYVEYFRAARERFAAALALDLPHELARIPEPVSWCANCEFRATCEQRRREVDHLGFVAGIRVDQRAKLAAVGITTLTELATTELDRVPGIGRDTFARLREQARLQHAARALRTPGVTYRRPAPDEAPGRGFALLPEPDPEDMFFDFEGYPYHEAGALEYLWGWTSRDRAGGALRFDHFWADTPEQEAEAFRRFLDEVHARRERSPGMHVFHYAPYEVTALRRLAHVHHHEQERLDELLRAGVFVDLYAVVRQALQVGTESYSIKQLEPLYGRTRDGDELADGGASIEVYEQWLLEGDEAVRSTIIDYNRVDCDSTLELRDWLLEHREQARAAGIVWPTAPEPSPADADEASDEAGDEASEDGPHPTRVLVERLEAIAADATRPADVRLAARLLSAMPGWQRRTRREFFGELHARSRDREVEEYVEDPNALGGLVLEETDGPDARGTTRRRYRHPAQATLVDADQDAIDPTSVRTVGSVEAVDHEACTVTIKTTRSQQQRLDAAGASPVVEAIVGWNSIPIDKLEPAAREVGEALLAALDAGRDPFAPDAPGAAALSMLARRATRVVEGAGPASLDHAPDPARLAELVRRADGSHVIVQGPPGTGKTWTSARLVAALVESGLRVGISSNSHDAVINVLRGIDEYRSERERDGRPLALRCAYKLRHKERAPGTFGFGEEWIIRPKSSDDACDLVASGEAQVLAGSAWQFVKDCPLDVVLVDEAGQVSLLHATAMASRARRVVLVGDPQQLPQPSSALHPHGCDASVLEHLFEGHAVLPPERAVLLPVTRRMHPAVAQLISEGYYEGRLEAEPATARQRVTLPSRPELPDAGVHLLAVPHAGNRTRSSEEVDAVATLVADLLRDGRVVPHPSEDERALRAEDIIVVAPYNAQRRALQEALGPDVRVGTVDKFQGQEAPVAILSLTASSRDELPRGLEFLLDPHRMNVAISRARALAVVVASPSLLATPAASLAEMRLLNDVARIAHASRSDAELALVTPPTR